MRCSSIDFETLPDGSPSWVPAEITREFNYTRLGVTFLPQRDPGLFIYGNEVTGFHLAADSYPSFERNWIIADLVTPASAVGVRYVFHGILSAYAADGTLLATVEYTWPGTHFLGIVSDTPIAYATIDGESYYASADEFVFSSVPEPGSGLGFIMSAFVVLARDRRRAVRQHR